MSEFLASVYVDLSFVAESVVRRLLVMVGGGEMVKENGKEGV